MTEPVNSWVPDLVIGVDFGMTCTGVAYSKGPEWPAPQKIQNWAGDGKVASRIAYDQNQQIASWGSSVDVTREDITIVQLFKLFLDPSYVSDEYGRPPHAEVKQWFVDYLRLLYDSVKQWLDKEIPEWTKWKTEFLFSTPTTWTSPVIVAEIRALVKKAGFGREANHHVLMSLTEVEAAAVHASQHGFAKDDILLMCDMGGGTTDVDVLKIKDKTIRHLEVEPLTSVQGIVAGSALIDWKFEEIVRRHLNAVERGLVGSPQRLAQRVMANSNFEDVKHDFNLEATNSPHGLQMELQSDVKRFDRAGADIVSSALLSSRDELPYLFEFQLEQIFHHINAVLTRLQSTHPNTDIKYLVLSGGFSQSPYAKKRFEEHFAKGTLKTPHNARNLVIRLVSQPQLAVVLGLVAARSQVHKLNTQVFSRFCARSSFGILVRQKYNPQKHQNQRVVKDPEDQTSWAEDQVDWLIKKDQIISVESGIEQSYRIKLPAKIQSGSWTTKIFMTTLPSFRLPKSCNESTVTCLGELRCRFDANDLTKLKNDHWWTRGKKYYLAEFSIKAIVGAADIKFEVLNRNKEKRNTNDLKISVDWNLPGNDVPTTDMESQYVLEKD